MKDAGAADEVEEQNPKKPHEQRQGTKQEVTSNVLFEGNERKDCDQCQASPRQRLDCNKSGNDGQSHPKPTHSSRPCGRGKQDGQAQGQTNTAI